MMEAFTVLTEIVQKYPSDVFALKLALNVCILTGQSEEMLRIINLVEHRDKPEVLSMISFAYF